MDNPSELPQKTQETMVIYNMENAVKQGVEFIKNVNIRMDICVDRNGPRILTENSIYKSNYISARDRGAKIRLLTEITKENINYCKLLLPIVDEIRHLDGLKGSLCVSDIEFIGSTTWRKKGPSESYNI